ncbi:MAG: mechanosensitive ion channel [Cyclobacteriaceae bacterium]|nr:mechanosensitive ion channel [Cyclobacteriaceae bacterium]
MQQMEDWLYTGFIVLLALVVGYIVYRLAFAAIKRIVYNVDDKGRAIVMRLRLPLAFFFLLISFFLIVPFTGTMISDSAHLSHISSLVVIFSIAWLLIKIISVMKTLAVKKYDINTSDNLKARKAFTQYNILERVATFIIILLAVGLALMTFEGIRKIGVSLLASAGIAGIILGFAAQRLIATVLAGLQLAITQPIRLDDVVIVENEWGWIEEITLTYVIVRIWDKRRLVLPTIYFIEKPFQNWTRTSADILGTVFIYADYQLPIDALREELKNILAETDLWDGKVSVIQVTDATERSMQIRILVSANTSPRAWDLRVLIRERMITFIQKNYPQCLPKSRVELNPAGEPASLH